MCGTTEERDKREERGRSRDEERVQRGSRREEEKEEEDQSLGSSWAARAVDLVTMISKVEVSCHNPLMLFFFARFNNHHGGCLCGMGAATMVPP